MIKSILVAVLSAFMLMPCATAEAKTKGFVAIYGTNLVAPGGERLFIKGTNLGNWLNPEGYMFGFKKTNCGWMISLMIAEAAGTDFAREFWQAFRENYITEDDIRFIASTGANTVRLPFNYKMFTHEDYMGLNDMEAGFRMIDRAVEWCRKYGLYLILDMHDCPGGQTGDNIDNGHGYPWLFESEPSQRLFCEIWRRIALRYKDEPVIMAYEPMNEPIAHYFDNKEQLNALLEPLYKRVVKAIREVDTNHIVMIGGAQWNGNFSMFTDWTFDKNIMYTCHRYGGEPVKKAFAEIISFRDRTGLPMYMGETGHNTDEWQSRLVRMMTDNNIGYTFWPYKKLGESCMNAIVKPEAWDSVVVKFAEADRSSFGAIRTARPDQQVFRRLMMQFAENARFPNCVPQTSYIESMGMK